MRVQIKMIFTAALLGCLLTAGGAENPQTNGVSMKIEITSTAFAEGIVFFAIYLAR